MPSPLDVARLPLRMVDDVTRIAEAVAQLPLLLTDVRNDVHALALEIDGLTRGLEQMERRLARMEAGIDPLDDDLASVEKGMHALPPKLDGLREQIEALRTDLSGLPFVGKS
jgi:chromosome segregation ATPase